jgi:hypothetical protein
MAAMSDSERVSYDLRAAEAQWGRIPDVERTIASWPEAERTDYYDEFALEYLRLRRLRDAFDQERMTLDELVRYRALLCVIRGNRPIAERILQNAMPALDDLAAPV